MKAIPNQLQYAVILKRHIKEGFLAGPSVFIQRIYIHVMTFLGRLMAIKGFILSW